MDEIWELKRESMYEGWGLLCLPCSGPLPLSKVHLSSHTSLFEGIPLAPL